MNKNSGWAICLTILLSVLSLMACSSSLSDDMNDLHRGDVAETLYAPWDTIYDVESNGKQITALVKCTGRWIAWTDAEWIALSQTAGAGNASLTLDIDRNTYTTPRTAFVTIALESNRAKQYSLVVNQQESSSFLAPLGIEKGAGYGYDIKEEYCKGMTHAIFNLYRLDYLQRNHKGHALHFVEDDISTFSEEEYIEGETVDMLKQQFSAKASVDLNAVIGKLDVTGTVTSAEIDEKNSVYAIKRSKYVLFARDIQYSNIMQYLLEEKDSTVFAPGFLADWQALQRHNDMVTLPTNKQCEDFLDKWGCGFVARSFLGGTVDYRMQIDKTILTDSLDCTLALDATVAGGLVKADGSAGFAEVLKKIKEKYSLDISIRGGDVQAISTILLGESITVDDMHKWQQSLHYAPDANESNVVVVDVKIASIANLFTGKVREKMKRMIESR